MEITGDILIGAQRVRGGERSFRAINPATGEVLEPVFAFANAADVDQACNMAWDAFHVFRATGPEQRARFLEAIGENIMAIGHPLVARATAETGLPAARIEGERARTVGQLKLPHLIRHSVTIGLESRSPRNSCRHIRRRM